MTAVAERLYRDPANGWFGGVCAGMADHFTVSVEMVRICWVMGAFILTPPLAFLIYLGFTALLPKRNAPPHADLHDVAARLRAFEQRVARLEAAVLSEEFNLRRDFSRMQ